MEIISNSEVELTSTERMANVRFEGMLDRGFSVHRAARRTEELFPGLDPAFYRWLRGEVEELSPWHLETWSFVSDTLREEMEDAGFEVHVNENAKTLTIVAGSNALAIAPVSNTRNGTTTGVAALAH